MVPRRIAPGGGPSGKSFALTSIGFSLKTTASSVSSLYFGQVKPSLPVNVSVFTSALAKATQGDGDVYVIMRYYSINSNPFSLSIISHLFTNDLPPVGLSFIILAVSTMLIPSFIQQLLQPVQYNLIGLKNIHNISRPTY